MSSNRNSHGESLEQVEQRFRRWRGSRKQGQRIPADLCAAAAGMTRQHGVHRVARELRLDYNGLKKRVGPVGHTRRAAKIDGPVWGKALTRFYYEFDWDGRELLIQSRAIDETGYVQPTLETFRKGRGPGTDYHFNSIRTWLVESDGRVFFGG